MDFVARILKMMPVWFGIGFLGPVLAEIYLRTPFHSLVPIQATSAEIYTAFMIIGGLYGAFALRFGRWI
ncbi:MAG TPA: hypothetical protein DCS39_00285 [Rhodobiaceae bacterium]|nr:hypothetical protein [Rhodobiaceae bacterium]|tara:strand:- start:2776 stop:2982 length:207 start_codon:yes stop_codon:yes gene_type:complete